MKETQHGTYHYGSDGYSVSEQPEMNEYEVYLNDEQIGTISLHYRTSETYSVRHGGGHERNERQMWTFQMWGIEELDDEMPPQIPTDEEFTYQSSSYWTRSTTVTIPVGYIDPSDAITATFSPNRFHNIKGAFKHFIALHTAWLDQVMVEDDENTKKIKKAMDMLRIRYHSKIMQDKHLDAIHDLLKEVLQ